MKRLIILIAYSKLYYNFISILRKSDKTLKPNKIEYNLSHCRSVN